MSCDGNTAETCGGGNRLDLYSYGYGNGTALPSATWNFRGCYTDSVAARTLGHTEVVPGGATATTVEACQAVCHGLGYTLAGVEYADECCRSLSCILVFNSLTVYRLRQFSSERRHYRPRWKPSMQHVVRW
jgi:hypothetical protein